MMVVESRYGLTPMHVLLVRPGKDQIRNETTETSTLTSGSLKLRRP